MQSMCCSYLQPTPSPVAIQRLWGCCRNTTSSVLQLLQPITCSSSWVAPDHIQPPPRYQCNSYGGALCQRQLSSCPRVACVPVMGSGCAVGRVHGAGLVGSVHCSGCARWRAALLVCTHPECRLLPPFEEDHAWRTSSDPGMSGLSARLQADGYGASSPPCWHGARGRGIWGRLPWGGRLGLAVRVAFCCRCVFAGIFALRAHCALLLDYVPPEEPPTTPLGNALRIK